MLVNAKAGVEEAKPQIGIIQSASAREFNRIEIDNGELGSPYQTIAIDRTPLLRL
jgi:hypothetical protein